jgi:hypothetical protein
MKLLFEKQQQHKGRKSKDFITISKTGVSINGNSATRLLDFNKKNYGGVGINPDGNLCLYLSTTNDSRLLSLYRCRYKYINHRMTINTTDAKNALKPYYGDYEIKYVSISKAGPSIKEVVLKAI